MPKAIQLFTLGISALLYFLPLMADDLIRIKKAVVFGDSLADTGNTQQLFQYFRGQAEKPWFFSGLFSRSWNLVPTQLFVGDMPPSGYYRGRFSNGPLAGEISARMLGLDTNNPDQYLNLAFGGSWTVPPSQFLWSWAWLWQGDETGVSERFRHLAAGQGKWVLPSASEVADWYLQNNQQLDGDTLYVMAAGANDYQNGYWDVDAVVTYQASIIEQLIIAGARHIGWGTLPDLTFTPCFYNNESVGKIVRHVEQHNVQITRIKKQLETAYPSVKIIFLDGYAAMKLFFKHAEAFGFTVTDRGCTNVMIPGCYDRGGQSIMEIGSGSFEVCENPDQFFFWDDMHPTARAYEHIATYMCVHAGLEGYWTDCQLPGNFNEDKAETLFNLLIKEGMSKSVIPDQNKVRQLLKLVH